MKARVAQWRWRRQLIEHARLQRRSRPAREPVPAADAGPFNERDRRLIAEGRHIRMFDLLGARPARQGAVSGVRFGVWAPNAARVAVIGDFNGWAPGATPLTAIDGTGMWTGFVPESAPRSLYKFHITSRLNGYQVEKADPYAFAAELRPATASLVWDHHTYRWNDDDWMAARLRRQALSQPISVYEVHLGSWRRSANGRPFQNYRQLAPALAEYASEMGFTHVQLLPVTEHPFDGSWGYQCTGYFAPTSRFGTPDDFKAFVDTLHQAGIGVLLDWVPGHFPRDRFALEAFDGTCLYEHADPRRGAHPHWGTLIFNLGRNEVRSFLLSSANFWAEAYHIDGFRVDAVASMLYLDYGRGPGEWMPNEHGGRENLEAITFLRDFNRMVHTEHPGVLTIAEESTAWPGVTHPVSEGGLGFDLKWNMGWMNDTLRYMRQEPIHRRWHHNDLTFSMLYAWSEQFMLPLSHDEVVHGKGSLVRKMPGDDWQKFANARLLLAYQYAHPGKKLLFMGSELGVWDEWCDERAVPFELARHTPHGGMQQLVRDLNRLHKLEPALHELDGRPDGFRWIDCHDAEQSVLVFLRQSKRAGDFLLVAANFTPVVRHDYRVGVPLPGVYCEVFNSDAAVYGGSNVGNLGARWTDAQPWHGRPHSLALALPPLGLVMLKLERTRAEREHA